MEHLSSAETAKRQDGAVVRELIEGAIKAQLMMGQEMDLADIWGSDDFLHLSESAQESVLAWAGGKGYPLPESATEPPSEEARVQPSHAEGEKETTTGKARESAPSSVPPIETRESRESRGNLPKRVFNGYRLVHDDDGTLRMKEDFRVRDDRSNSYRDGEVETSITLTRKLAEEIADDEGAAKAIEERCAEMRRALDRKGVKIFFDRPRDSNKVYPKWKYEIEDGQPQQERIIDVPPFIIEMVRTNPDYYKAEEYKNWYGPLMQRKRETIISEKLASEHPDEVPRQKDAEPLVASTPIKKQTEQKEQKEQKVNILDVRTMTPGQARESLRASAGMLAEKFEPLFKLPEQTEKYVTYVTDFARSIFSQSFRSPMSKEESANLVRDVLLERYANNTEMIEAINRHLPEAIVPEKPSETAVEPQATEKAPEANVASENLSTEETVSETDMTIDTFDSESFKEAGEAAAAEAEYKNIRKALAAVTDPDAFERHIGELEKTIHPDNGAASRAAQLVLAEIELGRVGEASEKRLTGLRRSPAEQQLLQRHPELNARNIRIDENEQLVAFIDRQNIEDGVKRVMRRVTESALGDAEQTPEAQALADRIANYLMEMLLAKNQNEATRQRFAQRLASYHVTDSEVHFKDVEALVSTVSGLAKKLQTEEKK